MRVFYSNYRQKLYILNVGDIDPEDFTGIQPIFKSIRKVPYVYFEKYLLRLLKYLFEKQKLIETPAVSGY